MNYQNPHYYPQQQHSPDRFYRGSEFNTARPVDVKRKSLQFNATRGTSNFTPPLNLYKDHEMQAQGTFRGSSSNIENMVNQKDHEMQAHGMFRRSSSNIENLVHQKDYTHPSGPLNPDPNWGGRQIYQSPETLPPKHTQWPQNFAHKPQNSYDNVPSNHGNSK